MKRSKSGTKEKSSPDGLNYPIQNTIIINIICQYLIRDGKSIDEIQLTKKQNGYKTIMVGESAYPTLFSATESVMHYQEFAFSTAEPGIIGVIRLPNNIQMIGFYIVYEQRI